MPNDNEPDKSGSDYKPGFFSTLLQGMIRDTFALWMTFLIGCAVGLAICLYIGAPLIYSLVGGVLVLAAYVAHDKL